MLTLVLNAVLIAILVWIILNVNLMDVRLTMNSTQEYATQFVLATAQLVHLLPIAPLVKNITLWTTRFAQNVLLLIVNNVQLLQPVILVMMAISPTQRQPHILAINVLITVKHALTVQSVPLVKQDIILMDLRPQQILFARDVLIIAMFVTQLDAVIVHLSTLLTPTRHAKIVLLIVSNAIVTLFAKLMGVLLVIHSMQELAI